MQITASMLESCPLTLIISAGLNLLPNLVKVSYGKLLKVLESCDFILYFSLGLGLGASASEH